MKVLKKNLADEVTWQYEGVVLSHKENEIMLEALFNRDDMPFMDITLKRNDRFVETFYSDRWYNIFEIYDRDDGRFKGWYCNIGKPAVITDDFVSYVDLALDLWVSANGTQTVLDEDELEELNLDDELKRKVYDSLRELQEVIKTKKSSELSRRIFLSITYLTIARSGRRRTSRQRQMHNSNTVTPQQRYQ